MEHEEFGLAKRSPGGSVSEPGYLPGVSREQDPWYREGLRFECTRCGRCCRGAGNVWVNDDEISALSARLEICEEEFRDDYTRRAGRRGVSLKQKRNQDCVFWDAKAGCSVYEDRPRQCRTYPFWAGIVHSEDNWLAEGKACPGIGEGPLHLASAITEVAADDGIPAGRTRLRIEKKT